MPEISALILAAGKGRRTGSPKYQLCYGGKTFFQHIYDNLFGCKIKKILTVIRKDYEESFKNKFKKEYVINETPDNGMLSSVITGFNKLKKYDAIIVYPVDHPLVKKETIENLIYCYISFPGNIIKPLYKKLSGHPIIIPLKLFDNINPDEYKDLNSIIKNSKIESVYLISEDEGVIRNINTGDDLKNIR